VTSSVIELLDLLAELSNFVFHVLFFKTLLDERSNQQLMLFVETFLRLLQLLELFVEVLNSLDGSTEFIIRLKDLTFEVGDV